MGVYGAYIIPQVSAMGLRQCQNWIQTIAVVYSRSWRAGTHFIGQKPCGRSLFIKLFSFTTHELNIKKIKQLCYRPGVVQRVPGS